MADEGFQQVRGRGGARGGQRGGQQQQGGQGGQQQRGGQGGQQQGGGQQQRGGQGGQQQRGGQSRQSPRDGGDGGQRGPQQGGQHQGRGHQQGGGQGRGPQQGPSQQQHQGGGSRGRGRGSSGDRGSSSSGGSRPGSAGYATSATSGSPASQGSRPGSSGSYAQQGGGGGRGYHGGGGGGGRGGRGPPPSFTKDPLPCNYTVKDLPKIDKQFGGTGWSEFPYGRKEDVILQEYEGPPAQEAKELISVSVNHYPLINFRLPENIFHYEVTMERVRQPKKDTDEKKPPQPQPSSSRQQPRGGKKQAGGWDRSGKKGGGGSGPGPQPPGGGGDGGGPQGPRRLPKPLPQLVLQVVLDRIRIQTGHFGVVSDLSNNIYSTRILQELVYHVNLTEVDQKILQENDNGVILVTLSLTDQQVDTRDMQNHLDEYGTWRGYNMDTSVKTTLEQVLNAVVKSMPDYRFLPLGRSNIARWPEQNPPSLGSNVVCWRGISANISMGWKPYLCADLAHCAFLDDARVFDALNERGFQSPNDLSRWEGWQMNDAKSFLKNVKVKYTVNGRTLAGPVTDVLNGSVTQETFFWEERNREISVAEYFKLQYRIDLQPKGPCLVLRGKNKVPAELCVIKKGQSFSRKLDDNQTRNMLTVAKKDPDVLKKEIHREISSMPAANPVLQEFGVTLGKEMLRLDETRVLDAPQLRYGQGTMQNAGRGDAVITPANGKWEVWDSNFKFLSPKTVSVWGILTVGQCRLKPENIDSFSNKLMTFGERKGIEFQNNPLVEDMSNLREHPRSVQDNVKPLTGVFQYFKQQGCKLVVVIIPKKYSPLYSHVKQAAELNIGILTQCVVGQNVFKGMDATVQNILLKLNGKLGGINHVPLTPPNNEILKSIDILRCPMLIIGADVTHPPPGSMKKIGNSGKEVPIPSFAAVTASIDKTGMPFMMDIRAQRKADRGAAEVIQNLDEIVYKMLLMFFRQTKDIRPRKIIYFRDGVGEGQFPEVLHTEMLAMRRACSKFTDYDGGKYEPQITFVTVQKRHKTRIFYHGPKGVMNPPPGTVVDQEIVHQTENDFYLCSHAGMMGTSRPTRYHVLWDDSNFSADQIQTLTYYLCYMYIRCNKSVRIPAPTYYAHWAAARAKALTDGLDEYFGDLEDLNNRMKRHEGFMAEFPMHFV